MKTLLIAAALAFAPVSDTASIQLHDGKVTMPLKTFRGIATIIQQQRKMIETLRQKNMDVEACVRQNAGDNKAVTTCFGDQEL